MKRRGPFGRLVLGGLWLGMLAACRTPPPAPAPVLPPPAAIMSGEVDVGTVIRVHETDGYVILKCAILPYDLEELNIYRDEKKIGAVRLAGSKKPPYFAADIVSGKPARGDRAKRGMTPTKNRRVP